MVSSKPFGRMKFLSNATGITGLARILSVLRDMTGITAVQGPLYRPWLALAVVRLEIRF
jgi:hypothetical protein